MAVSFLLPAQGPLEDCWVRMPDVEMGSGLTAAAVDRFLIISAIVLTLFFNKMTNINIVSHVSFV